MFACVCVCHRGPFCICMCAGSILFSTLHIVYDIAYNFVYNAGYHCECGVCMWACVHTCDCVRARASARARVRVRVRVCVCVRVRVHGQRSQSTVRYMLIPTVY